ncbi:MAG: DNA adenine methylase [Acidobacteriota bacterium]
MSSNVDSTLDSTGRFAYAPDMTYPGGKNGAGVYQTIINNIPPHRLYIEPFLGSGAVMRNKLPAQSSIGIDADERVLEGRWHGFEIPNLSLVHSSALDFLRSYHFKPDVFVYCDPPYLAETRRGHHRRIYRCEMMSREEHEELLDVLLLLPCMVAISSYHSGLYAEKLSAWRAISFQAQTRSGKSATEWLWMNYPEPAELHDYRYLGENYKKRQDFKRMRQRWMSKLRRMPAIKRYAMLSAIEEVFSDHTGKNACGGSPITNSDSR